MDFDHYCKECGDPIEFEYGKTTAYCPTCKKEIELKNTIAGYTRDARVAQLKAMHQLMCIANDESLYMTWINVVPDCPSNEDFIDIAINDREYNHCFNLFAKLIAKSGNRYQVVYSGLNGTKKGWLL